MDSLGIMWVLKRKTILAKKMTIRILFHEGHAKEGAYGGANVRVAKSTCPFAFKQ